MTALTRIPAKPKNLNFLLRMVLLGVAFVVALGLGHVQGKSEQKPTLRQAHSELGKATFLKYCASCHGEDGKGKGPAAVAMKTQPQDLTTLSRRHDGKYPSGYVSAIVKFGRSLAAHGSEDMPVWGPRFKALDPVRDPTGQQHLDDLVAYIESLQAK
jgi:mono/diheme cytochrome c family protein